MQRKKTTIRKRMIFYFLLIAIANIFAAGEIIFEIKSEEYRNEVLSEMYRIEEKLVEPEIIYSILDDLIKKFSVMIIILIVVSAVVLFLFVLQIASPLHYMIKQAGKMSEGDLSGRVSVHTNDELADMAHLVNDLSTNLQEVIAQVERISEDTKKLVALHRKNINRHPKLPIVFKQETNALHKVVQDLILLKQAFVLYRVKFDKEVIEDDTAARLPDYK